MQRQVLYTKPVTAEAGKPVQASSSPMTCLGWQNACAVHALVALQWYSHRIATAGSPEICATMGSSEGLWLGMGHSVTSVERALNLEVLAGVLQS